MPPPPPLLLLFFLRIPQIPHSQKTKESPGICHEAQRRQNKCTPPKLFLRNRLRGPPSYPVSAPSVTTRSLWQLLAKSTARTPSGFASNRLVTLCHRLLFHRPLFYFLSKIQELQPFCIFSQCLIVRWSRPVLSRSTLHWPRDCFGTMPLLSSVPLVSVL